MDEQIEQEKATVEKTDEQPKKKRNFRELDRDTQRFYNLLHMIWNLCNIAGFKLEGRIKLRDKKSGKVWE